ncbi:MAG: OprO/OprP family phosphate-selective porin [Hyphomicrobiales bacterium]
MRKIFSSMVFLLASAIGFSQNVDKSVDNNTQDADAIAKNGSIRFLSDNGDVKLKIGARFAFDAAYYFDDITDLGSGTKVGEARFRAEGTFYKNFSAKIDVDFRGKSVTYADIFGRYHINDNSFVTLGHFAEPFSPIGMLSSGETRFIGRPMTVQAFAPGRHLGISYRTFGDKYWFEGGIFGNDVYETVGGDEGYGATARGVYRPLNNDNYMLQVGVSASYRTATTLGVKDGDDDYNTLVSYRSKLESSKDNTYFLDAHIPYAKDQMKLGVDLVGFYKNFHLIAEYNTARVTREKDYERLFEEQLGGEFSWVKLENFVKWYGEMNTLNFDGYYVQAGWIITGQNYSLDKKCGMLSKTPAGSLELVARYNHTNLDDIDGKYFAGKFYENVGTGQPNNSISGGVADTYGVGLNYYWKPNIRFMLDYNYMKLDSHEYLDKNIGVLQVRTQIGF